MKLTGYFIYDDIEEFVGQAKEKQVHVGDQVLIHDIDGGALYTVADIDEAAGHYFMVREHLLKDQKPIRRGKFNLFDWLNDEYKKSLPEELIELMVADADKLLINLPREIEVFGKNIYAHCEEAGHQWEYFKKTKNRIATVTDSDEWSHWWWLSTPEDDWDVASAAYFCSCSAGGGAACDIAGNAGSYVRPRFILAVAES
jgi:hypothetical protein